MAKLEHGLSIRVLQNNTILVRIRGSPCLTPRWFHNSTDVLWAGPPYPNHLCHCHLCPLLYFLGEGIDPHLRGVEFGFSSWAWIVLSGAGSSSVQTSFVLCAHVGIWAARLAHSQGPLLASGLPRSSSSQTGRFLQVPRNDAFPKTKSRACRCNIF